MSKRIAVRRTVNAPICIGGFTFTETGVSVKGHPSFGQYQGALEFAEMAVQRSPWWVASLVAYGDRREDWREMLSQASSETGLDPETIKNMKYVAENVAPERRRADVSFSHHTEVAKLPPADQTKWLKAVADKGLTRRELRLEIRATHRQKVIEGQAVLEGQYRVIYADPPWLYGNKPPSGSGASEHYSVMTIGQICALPVQAHTRPDAVLFIWTTAPMLYENPGPREVIEAWGFKPKTQRIWCKVQHNFGNYFSVRHEILILATRGSCLPDHPVPMLDSVVTERPTGEHSEKPETFRKDIEKMYNGPYLELFGRKPVENWSVFGNDSRLWHREVAS